MERKTEITRSSGSASKSSDFFYFKLSYCIESREAAHFPNFEARNFRPTYYTTAKVLAERVEGGQNYFRATHTYKRSRLVTHLSCNCSWRRIMQEMHPFPVTKRLLNLTCTGIAGFVAAFRSSVCRWLRPFVPITVWYFVYWLRFNGDARNSYLLLKNGTFDCRSSICWWVVVIPIKVLPSFDTGRFGDVQFCLLSNNWSYCLAYQHSGLSVRRLKQQRKCSRNSASCKYWYVP